MLSKAEARKIMLSMRATSEALYFGRPAIFYAESFVGRVHDKEEAVALRVGTIEMGDVMLEAEPKLFYITDHYKSWPMLLAQIERLDRVILKALVQARMGGIDAKTKRKKRAPKVSPTETAAKNKRAKKAKR